MHNGDRGQVSEAGSYLCAVGEALLCVDVGAVGGEVAAEVTKVHELKEHVDAGACVCEIESERAGCLVFKIISSPYRDSE